MICGSVRAGRVCIYPKGHRYPESHRAADGKRWYYDDAFLRRRWVARFEYAYSGWMA